MVRHSHGALIVDHRIVSSRTFGGGKIPRTSHVHKCTSRDLDPSATARNYSSLIEVLRLSQVPTGNPHGKPRYTIVSYGGPWCTLRETVGSPTEPTVSRGIFFFPRGIPRVPAGSHGISWYIALSHVGKKKHPAGIPSTFPPIIPMQPKVLDIDNEGNLRLMRGLSSRRTCRGAQWDPMGRTTGTPMGPRGTFRGKSQGNHTIKSITGLVCFVSYTLTRVCEEGTCHEYL